MAVGPKSRRSWLPAAALLYGLLAHLYFVLRHQGWWLDADTASMTGAAELFAKGRMPVDAGIPHASLFSYGTSAGYPLSVAIHAEAMGIPIVAYQQLIHPIIGIVGLGAVYVLVRRLSPNPYFQGAAVFLAATSPDFLFETSRGSHGAYTIALLALSLAGLFVLFKGGGADARAWTVLSLLALAGLALLNGKRAIMAGSILLLVAGPMLILVRRGTIAPEWKPSRGFWLLAAAPVVVAIAMLFTPFGLQLLETVSRDVGGLLSTAPSETGPQPAGTPRGVGLVSYLTLAWGSPWRYLLVAAWVPLLAGLGFVAWLKMTRDMLGKRAAVPPALGFVWALSAALGGWVAAVGFGVLRGVVYSVDLLRILTIFSICLSLLGAWLLVAAQGRWGRGRGTRFALVLLVGWLALAGPAKATSEPSLTHHWRFVDRDEVALLRWMPPQGGIPTFAGGADDPGWANRILDAYDLVVPGVGSIRLDWTERPPLVLDSQTGREYALARDVPLPSVEGYHRLYDNGGAAFYVRAAVARS